MDFISFITISMFCMSPILTLATNIPEKSSLETYIVHVEGPDQTQLSTDQSQDLESLYNSFLPATTTSSSTDQGSGTRIVHSYRSVFRGFAAKLSPNEVKEMSKKNGFISARPEKTLSFHTTHSPHFLGLNQNMGLWRDSNYGKGVIIGVLDSGIAPDHPSFSDQGMPPPPAKWKGKCEFNHTTPCNNKIIGARSFGTDDDDENNQNQSPVDRDGHGTHTASTAAGNFVKGANLFGNANGTAVGVAPLTHLAIYSVCTSTSCSESTILAGMDAAIEDGVDVLSISLGEPEYYLYEDYLAIGAFSAMEKGIVVSCSAGNDGPSYSSLNNDAPWILTVGASTMDRELRATAVLGNNQMFHGESAFQPNDFPQTLLPLVNAAMLNTSDPSAAYCVSFDGTDIRGKMVVCDVGLGTRIEKGEAVKSAGGAAMILVNNEQYANTTFSEAHVLPATHVGYADGLKIKAYINSTKTPVAKILFGGTVIGDDRRAPVVAGFSSRGPSLASPGILKPDILGPGVNILAAWPTSVENNYTNAKSTFNIVSGTSMSCPHLSGVAALLKSSHPDWSPAAIKSAIMTTANVVNLAHDPIEDARFVPADIFTTGSGHVNPSAANAPGLIYDIQSVDYIPYLCGLNYTNRQVGVFLQRRVNCSVESSVPQAQLNYPSFALTFTGQQANSQTYARTVTNVGDPNSLYTVEIVRPPGIEVRVVPNTLKFSEINQKLQYKVTFVRLASAANNTVVQGFLNWSSSKHSARSPFAVMLV